MNPLGVSHCENCKAPTENAICWRCTQILRSDLKALKPLIGELDIQIMKQNVEPRQPGSSGKKTEYPILFNIQASALLDSILDTLVNLLKQTVLPMDRWKVTINHLSRTGKARVYLNHLELQVVPLSRVQGAFHDIRSLKTNTLRMIDRQARRKALGVCPTCQHGLFATDDQEEVECCGTTFNTEEHREKMNTLARSHWVTAKEAIVLGESEGVRFNASTIRSWVNRGRLVPRQPQYAGQERHFRFGDLLDLARED